MTPPFSSSFEALQRGPLNPRPSLFALLVAHCDTDFCFLFSIFAAESAFAVSRLSNLSGINRRVLFLNFGIHLPQQNLATSSTLFELLTALPLIGHFSLIASAANAVPSEIEIEKSPMTERVTLKGDDFLVGFNLAG
jgi:hypothetical protein